MNLIKPIIVNGGGSAIELADNLTTTEKGKALDATQGTRLWNNLNGNYLTTAQIKQTYAKKVDIPTMPNLSEYAKKTDLLLHSYYPSANNYTAYLSILSSVNTETKVIDLMGSEEFFMLNTNSYKIAAGSRCTITIEGFSPYSGLAIFKPTYSYNFKIIPYPLALTANSHFSYKCYFENMYDMTKTMTNIGSLQLIYLEDYK